MSEIKIYQIDAFASQPFEGNPAAVCPLEEWLPDETMQKIAAENNLAETAFIVNEPEGFRIRWFTPAVEVDLCGHATLASAFVLFNFENHSEDEISFNSRSGVLKVKKLDDDQLQLDFPADELEVTEAPTGLFESLGISGGEVYKGKTDYLVVVEHEQAVAEISPDFRALGGVEARGVIVTAHSDKYDFVSRFFAPQSGIDEDPVTGSAHTSLTPFWAERLGKDKLTAKQISPRGGELLCQSAGDRVKISGKAIKYLKGVISV